MYTLCIGCIIRKIKVTKNKSLLRTEGAMTFAGLSP